MSGVSPKNKYVTDTMALVLRLEQRKLNPQVKRLFSEAEQGQVEIRIPSLVFAEIMYLWEKRRIQCGMDEVKAYLAAHDHIREEPLTRQVIESAQGITDIPELHDRIIAATASLLGWPIITNDPVITASKFVTAVWS